MKRLLLNRLVASVVRMEISRDADDPTKAQLTVKNDVKIQGEIKSRASKLKLRTVDIPESAHVLFEAMKKELNANELPLSDERMVNLPEMPRDTTDFSATITIDIGDRNDDELRELFQAAFKNASQSMAAGRFRRKAGNWSDRKGGTGSGTVGL